MPKLLAYLPCEKVVVEEHSKNVSVLSILETVTLTIAKHAPAPSAGTSIAMGWAIFALWQKERGESGEFESKSVLLSPAGEPLADTPIARLSFAAHARQQVINRMAGFPVGVPGVCQLKLMVKTVRDTEFRELANVSIVVRHSRG